MSILTKDQIMKVDDLKIETVDVSKWWDGEVLVMGMTGTGRDAFEAETMDLNEEESDETEGKISKKNLVNFRARLVAATVVDENLNLIFNPGDIIALGLKNGAALDKIFDVSQRLSGLTDIEEKVKNSETGPKENTTSD